MNLVSSFTYKPDSESFLQSKHLQLPFERQGEVFFCLCFQSSGNDGSVHPTFKSLDFRSFMLELREMILVLGCIESQLFHTP